ncbi:MAG TPA: LptF/LptG family permease, partial [Chthoniobacteraceae bacterium]|nr:LptF/LptG family permease [Chthoniobacteraceae bacterium]
MRILDRYILKNFLVPFLYCFLGFIAIWLAFDLAQRTDDLINAKLAPSVLLFYYGTQIPEFVIIILPAALLLALLYSLSRMSRSNEIISILSSGVSLYRLIVPLVAMGLLVAGVCFAMNYKLAPHAEIFKKLDLLGREHDFERLSAEVEKDRQKMDDAKTKLDDIGRRGNVIDPNPEDGKSAVQNATPEYNQAKADYLKVENTFNSYRQFQDTFYVPDALLFRNRADSRTWIVQLRTTVLSPYQRAAHP